MTIEVSGRIFEASDLKPSERLCLLKDHLQSIAPRGVSKQDVMDMFAISEPTFYRYVRKLEGMGVPVMLRISYEYAVMER